MATQTIYTGKDAYTYSGNPTQNYGSGNTLYCVNDTVGDNEVKRPHIGFDITSAPSSEITSVLLYIHGRYFSMSGFSAYFRRITGAWTEAGLTWNNAPAVTNTNQYTHDLPNDDSWYSYDITNLYTDAKSAGNELGIRIQRVAEGNYPEVEAVWSREYSGSHDPYILITYGITDYYVKVGGNDALPGNSWANAWATINKAATTVADGKTVHIGFGTYGAEPAGNKIAPQNIGATGIFYLPETAETGGGTGTVSVEQN